MKHGPIILSGTISPDSICGHLICTKTIDNHTYFDNPFYFSIIKIRSPQFLPEADRCNYDAIHVEFM